MFASYVDEIVDRAVCIVLCVSGQFDVEIIVARVHLDHLECAIVGVMQFYERCKARVYGYVHIQYGLQVIFILHTESLHLCLDM